MERIAEVTKKQLLNRFSGHGLPNVCRTHNLPIQILWGSIWVFVLIFAIFFVNQGINDYFSYHIEIKSQVINEYPLLFPKVTICNRDPFTTNSSIKFLADTIRRHVSNETQSIVKRFDNSDLNLVNYFVEHESEHSFKVTSLFYANLTDLETKKSLGYSIKELVHSCQFGVWKCDLNDDFQWNYNYKLGNCFTFNPTNDKEKMISVYQAGKMNGLQLELFVGKRDDYDSFTYSNGAKIYIYNHTTVYSESDSIDVSVGQETNINLAKKLIYKLKKPYSDCAVDFDNRRDVSTSKFYDIFLQSNYTYRQDDCLTLCYQMTLVKECNCFDFGVHFFNLFGIQTLKACGKQEVACMEKIFRHRTKNYYDSCQELCPKECQSVEFNFDVSFSSYPSNTQLKRVNRKNKFLQQHEDISDKILKVNIHFNKLNYEFVRELPALNVGKLLANIGGTLGLFLGFSVLSIIEVFELLLALFIVTVDITKGILKNFIVNKYNKYKSEKSSYKDFEPRREISYY